MEESSSHRNKREETRRREADSDVKWRVVLNNVFMAKEENKTERQRENFSGVSCEFSIGSILFLIGPNVFFPLVIDVNNWKIFFDSFVMLREMFFLEYFQHE